MYVPRLSTVNDGKAILPAGTRVVAMLAAPFEETADGAELVYGVIKSHTKSHGTVTYTTVDGTMIPADWLLGFSFGATIPHEIANRLNA